MGDRIQRMLRLLAQHGTWLTGKSLATLLTVSDRTIRHDMHQISQQYPHLIESSRRYGYRLTDSARHIMPDLWETALPQTPNERMNFLLKRLLREGQINNFEQLADELYISASTWQQDIGRAAAIIAAYPNLQLTNASKCLKLTGAEIDKRKLYRELLQNELQDDFANIDQIVQTDELLDWEWLKHTLRQLIAQTNYPLRPASYSLLLIHVGITVLRILSEQFVGEQYDYAPADKEATAVAEALLAEVSRNYHLQIPQTEVQPLARLLVSYRENNQLMASAYLGRNRIVFQEVLKEIGAILYHQLGIDFLADQEFVYRLHLHLQSLVERLNYHHALPNLYLHDLKRQYPLIFDMAVSISKRLAIDFGQDLSESEVGLIAIHLGAAYAQHKEREATRVVLILPDHYALMQNAVCQLKAHFAHRMVIVAEFPQFEQAQVEQYQPDLVISFVPLTGVEAAPVLVVSPFFTADDEVALINCLNTIERHQLDIKLALQLGNYLDDALFESQLEATDAQSVIQELSQRLAAAGVVDDTFLTSVLQREDLSSTDFDYGIAIPHPLSPCSQQSKIAVAVLKEPIMWHKYPVKLVIMLAIAEADRHFVRLFFNWLGACLANPQKMTQLFNARSRDALMAAILDDIGRGDRYGGH